MGFNSAFKGLKANGRNACHLLQYGEAALHREVTLHVPNNPNIQHYLFVYAYLYTYLFIFSLSDGVVSNSQAEQHRTAGRK